MPRKSKDTEFEQPTGKLYPGDPEAAYISPDLSNSTGAGTLPEAEQEWHDARDDAQADEADAAAEHEQTVLKRRAEEQEAEGKQRAERTEKQQAAAQQQAKPKPTSSLSS